MKKNNQFFIKFISLWFVIALIGLLKITYFQSLKIPFLPQFIIAFIAPLIVTILLRLPELSEKTKLSASIIMTGLTPLLKLLVVQISLKLSLSPHTYLVTNTLDTTQLWYKQLLFAADYAGSLAILFFIYYGSLNLIDYLKSKFIA